MQKTEHPVCVRQICFMLFAYATANKLLLYPANLSFGAGNDLLFSALVNVILSTLAVWVVASLSKRTPLSFYELLKNSFGQVVATIVITLLSAYLVFASVMPLFEQKLFVQNIFYDTFPALPAVLPIFFFLVYVTSRPIVGAGRCADICMPIFVVALAVLLFMAMEEVRIDNLLPVLRTPVKAWVGTGISQTYHFTEPCWLLFMLGRFPYKKGDVAKITCSYLLSGVVLLTFLAVYYGVYSYLAPNHYFALSEIALFFSGVHTLGRVDFMAIYAVDLVMLFALALPLQMSVEGLKQAYPLRDARIYAVGINLLLLVALILFDHKFSSLQAFYGKIGSLITLVFALLLPVATLFLGRKGGKNA